MTLLDPKNFFPPGYKMVVTVEIVRRWSLEAYICKSNEHKTVIEVSKYSPLQDLPFDTLKYKFWHYVDKLGFLVSIYPNRPGNSKIFFKLWHLVENATLKQPCMRTDKFILIHEYRCMCTRKHMAQNATKPSNSQGRWVATVGNTISRNAVCKSTAQLSESSVDASIWNAGGCMSLRSPVTRALRDFRNLKPWTHVKQCSRFACHSRFNRHSPNERTLFRN